MRGRSMGSGPITYVAILVAIVAVAGTVALGWEWGETDDPVPVVIGVGAALLAVGWTLSTRVS